MHKQLVVWISHLGIITIPSHIIGHPIQHPKHCSIVQEPLLNNQPPLISISETTEYIKSLPISHRSSFVSAAFHFSSKTCAISKHIRHHHGLSGQLVFPYKLQLSDEPISCDFGLVFHPQLPHRFFTLPIETLWTNFVSTSLNPVGA
ncbi:hypothetical protein FVER53590_28303 [Fusarium verticillioides]|nr:hypothetical protein FVER53590_28303 [Fusarium verticillioides]